MGHGLRASAVFVPILAALLIIAGPSLAFAQDAASPTSSMATDVTVEDLYAFTLPAGAVPEEVGGAAFLRFTVAPGTRFDFSVSCWVSPAADAWYVEEGTFAIRPAAPARIVRATHGIGAADEPVAAGEEVVLEPGDLLVYAGLPADPGTFRNPGEGLASGLVFGVWGPEVASCPPTGMIEPWLEYRGGAEWTLPPDPLAFALQRVTLAPAARLPLPEADPGRALIILHAEEGSPTYEGAGAARMLTNTGDDPLIAVLLTITAVGPGTGTPEAGTPAP